MTIGKPCLLVETAGRVFVMLLFLALPMEMVFLKERGGKKCAFLFLLCARVLGFLA